MKALLAKSYDLFRIVTVDRCVIMLVINYKLVRLIKFNIVEPRINKNKTILTNSLEPFYDRPKMLHFLKHTLYGAFMEEA
jgi:hypothetical protein